MNKKKIIIISVSIIIILSLLVLIFLLTNKINTINTANTEVSQLKELPKPEITGGQRGELGIDKNINETTIDEYLNREDSVYRDMRMLEDPGNYENINGDRFLSGYIEGFEVIPLPYIIPVTGLPSEVGDTYTGTTLFYENNGTYIANYEESMDIIEEIFPKDKVIFLMCGGGGYSGMTKNFLVSLGWDENKIYNTGGYWYYKGEHSINVKKEVNGVISYDFDNVPYYNIEFDKLTKSTDYKAPIIKVTELKINTSKLELEEGTSFKLNVIVLPNEATNKEVKWTSSNEKVATVTNDGLVNAIGEGKATITVESINEKKTVYCEVTVNKKEIGTRIKIDNLSKEAEEFSTYDLNKLRDEEEEYMKYMEKVEHVRKIRLEMFNKLIDDKKSFIMLIRTETCEGDEIEYSVVEGAEKILKQNNYSYFEVATEQFNYDLILEESKLNADELALGWGTIAIIKNGELYAWLDSSVDSIKNDEETKNWLSKYIDIK